MGNLWGRQPVMILAVVQAGIALGVGFGAHITIEQMGLLMAFTAAVLGLLTGSQVTPMATLPEHVANTINNASNADVPKKTLVDLVPQTAMAPTETLEPVTDASLKSSPHITIKG